MFSRIFGKFEDLCVVQIGKLLLRFFAEPVDILRLAEVYKELLFMLMFFEHLDQLLDLCLSP